MRRFRWRRATCTSYERNLVIRPHAVVQVYSGWHRFSRSSRRSGAQTARRHSGWLSSRPVYMLYSYVVLHNFSVGRCVLRQNAMIWVLEAILWSLLVLFDGFVWSKLLFLFLIAAVCFPVFRNSTQGQGTLSGSSPWRQPSRRSDAGTVTGDDQGYIMGTSLFPILWKLVVASHDSNIDDPWLVTSVLAGTLAVARLNLAAAVAVIASLPALPGWIGDMTRFRLLVPIAVILYHALVVFPRLRHAATAGEWALLTGLLATAVVEWTLWDYETTHYDYIALSGGFGCLVACGISSIVRQLWIKFCLLTLVPLAFVERALLWSSNTTDASYPGTRSFSWLVGFLRDFEGPSGLPRGIWLAYWLALLPFALWLAPSCGSVIVTRKWFHLVAIILFVPITVTAPQLMSLSYAISLCGLLILESIKTRLPPSVQRFYTRYLDSGKDSPDGVVISHIALVTGCALPLWIHESLLPACQEQTAGLLPLLGTLVLGVGDSAGALLGSRFGRRYWSGHTGKTMEGSLAMWVCLMSVCAFFREHSMLAVTFVTLLEASTMQIDNLVLPLAGAAALVMANVTPHCPVVGFAR